MSTAVATEYHNADVHRRRMVRRAKRPDAGGHQSGGRVGRGRGRVRDEGGGGAGDRRGRAGLSRVAGRCRSTIAPRS